MNNEEEIDPVNTRPRKASFVSEMEDELAKMEGLLRAMESPDEPKPDQGNNKTLPSILKVINIRYYIRYGRSHS
jgi:hypothetical protein